MGLGLGSELSITVHSSQGLTIADPQKLWIGIIHDYLQGSNLAYLAASRVEHLSQLERVICPPEAGAGTLTEQQLRKVILRKLVAYKCQDTAKELRFNLKVDQFETFHRCYKHIEDVHVTFSRQENNF